MRVYSQSKINILNGGASQMSNPSKQSLDLKILFRGHYS